MTDIETLLARAAIVDGLARYCRAMDRLDDELALTVFSPDATVDYGEQFYRGTARGFITSVHELHAGIDATVHRIVSPLIRVDGQDAVSEAPGHVMLVRRQPDGRYRIGHGFGRYLDRWRLNDGAWTIQHRVYRRDVGWDVTVNAAPGGGFRDPADPSFGMFEGFDL